MPSSLTRALAFGLWAVLLSSGHAETLQVSPAAQAGAFQSLGAAIQAYASKRQCPADGVRIEIAPGTYEDERIVLKSVPCPLTIAAAGKGSDRPSFRGHNQGTWLNVSAPGAGAIPLVISGLEIADYQTAISLNGDRSRRDGWVGGVQIRNNRFVRIGSPGENQSPSTAAVRLVNARSNQIVGNEFLTVRNARSCGGLHSVYMAHMSSDNVIRNNSFVDGCGDTIKVRDQSNGNRVENNVFERQEGNALMLDSFCDKLSRSDCTKAEGECPSWNNVFDQNTVRGRRAPSNKKITVARQVTSDLSGVCPPPPPRAARIVEGAVSGAAQGPAAGAVRGRAEGFSLQRR